MSAEYDDEPIRGLPGRLPPGEAIVWQGGPDWRSLAMSVFHARLVAGWFVFAASLAFVGGGTGLTGAAITLGVAAIGLGVLALLAVAQARTTVYTLTNRRIVMRFGLALPKAVNIPLAQIGSAGVKPAGAERVDIALTTTERFPLAWLQMWPHVKPWRARNPEPMLRAVPADLAPLLARTLAAADPSLRRPVEAAAGPAQQPELLGVAA